MTARSAAIALLVFLFLARPACASQTAGLDYRLDGAAQLSTAGRHAEALKLLDELQNDCKKNTEIIGCGVVYSMIISIRAAMGDLSFAKSILQQQLIAAEKDSEVDCDTKIGLRLQIASLQFHEGDRKGALEEFHKFIATKDESCIGGVMSAKYLFSGMLIEDKRWDEARSNLEDVTKLAAMLKTRQVKSGEDDKIINLRIYAGMYSEGAQSLLCFIYSKMGLWNKSITLARRSVVNIDRYLSSMGEFNSDSAALLQGYSMIYRAQLISAWKLAASSIKPPR